MSFNFFISGLLFPNRNAESIKELYVSLICLLSITLASSFTALVVVGDKNGHVGAGLGKAAEIPEAIRKGKEDAMKKLIELPLDENGSVPHDFIGKFGSASVLLKKSPDGTGIIAGGPARNVLELAGFKNIRTKSLGSNNKQNVVLATIEGLKGIKTPEEVARLRGKSVDEIMG